MATSRLPIVVLTASAILLAAGGPIALASDAHGDHAKPAATPKPAAGKPEMKDDGKHETKPDAKPDAKPEARPTGGKPAAKADKDDDETPMRSARTPAAKAEPEPEGPFTAEAALKMLQDGNARWVSGRVNSPNTDTARRSATAENGQKPFVTVLTCADSRLPVERLFDRGVGEVFVVRVAGNVAGGSETGTIEYGVGHLKTPLLVVMGHTKCGAVAAAASGAELHGKLGELVAEITPAVDRARRNNPGADEKALASLAIKENVWQQVFTLIRQSPELRAAIGKDEIKVVGAICDITTGKVEFMGEHPWQTELVDAMNARAKGGAERQTAEAGHGE